MLRSAPLRWLLSCLLAVAGLAVAGPTAAAGDTKPPTIPTGLKAVTSSTGSTLTWKASSDNVKVTTYLVTVATQVKKPTTPKAVFGGLRPNTGYTAKVQAVDAAGNKSKPASMVFRTKPADTIAPSVPTSLSATPTMTGADLAWAASTDNIGVTGYVVTADGRSQRVTSPVATVTGLIPGTDYAVTVAATDAAGNTSGAATVAFRTLPEPDTTPPTTPAALRAAPSSTDAVVTWDASTDNVGVTGYVLALPGRTPETVTGPSAIVTGLTPATAYTATVTATDAAGNQSAAAEVTFSTLPPPDATAPSEPTDLIVSAPTSTSADVAWTAATDDVAVAGYRVTAAGRTHETTGTSITVTDLPIGTTTTVSVVAVDAAQNHSVPARINVRTLPEADAEAPTSPTVSVVPGSTKVTIAFGGSSDNIAVDRYFISVAGQTVNRTDPETITVTGLAAARTYQVRVSARDAAGNVSAATVVSFRTLAAGYGPDTVPPTSPSDLALHAGTTTLRLAWTPASDNVDVDHYAVTVGDVTRVSDTTALTVTGLTPSTPYDVQVVAVDAAGNASAPASGHAVTQAPPSAAAGLHGTIAWFGKSASRAQLDEALASPLVDGLSVYVRWRDVTTDGVTFDWSFFETARQAASAAGKPWNGMIIYGVVGNGMPAYVTDGLPAGELITIDGETFPTFWSAQAQGAARDLITAAAARFGSDPNLVQWRVTGLWSVNAEPRILGGGPGRRTWVETYRIAHPGADFAAVQAAYNEYEKQIWAEAAAAWPTRITLAQAGGLALADNVDALPNTDPAKHPQRLETWGQIRAQLGDRMIGQYNGVDAGAGAGGFGEWLPIAFGPNGFHPGRVGAQAIGGVSQDTRLTAEDFREMVRLLTVRGYSYGELYGSDVLYALRGRNAEALHMRETLESFHGAWTP